MIDVLEFISTIVANLHLIHHVSDLRNASKIIQIIPGMSCEGQVRRNIRNYCGQEFYAPTRRTVRVLQET